MIVPAILTSQRDEFIKMLNQSREYNWYVQIDIMDGKFVPSQSIDINILKGLKYPLGSEAHLMVDDPAYWIEVFKSFGAERVIFHFEINKDKEEIIDQISRSGLSVGLAVNPDTQIEDFSYLVPQIDVILFMSVVPGFYGSRFIPSVLDKIKKFKTFFPQKRIGIDGGIKIDNVRKVHKIGIDYICVGSAIFEEKSPKDAYQRFLEVTGE